jgi:hypothetical protein
MKRWVIGLALLLLPVVAHACPVCSTGFEQNREAFIETTAIMSFLPLALIGGVAYYWRKKSRERAEDEAERDR